jgi:hypothetical protein
MVTEGCSVGTGVGAAVTLAVSFFLITITSFVTTGAGVVTATVVCAGVAGAAGFEVHPASAIPMNRIARTTKSFFMHVFFVISVFNGIQISAFNPDSPDQQKPAVMVPGMSSSAPHSHSRKTPASGLAILVGSWMN